ncbi:MAG: ABC transporter ATP-binding protein [Victivallaceae bacterium]
MPKSLLRLQKLTVSAITPQSRIVPIVKNVSFEIPVNGSMEIVGQSGCGKTMIMKSVMGILPDNCRISSGEIFFGERLIHSSTSSYDSEIRGVKIGTIFQQPTSSLNPSMKIGTQMTEGPMYHLKINKAEAKELALHFLGKVKIENPEKCFHQYPFELSGGMQQRIVIASVLSCKPDLIIADEPTTALDSLSQFQVLNLLRELKEEYGPGLLLITHNLAIVPEICQTITVMHQGSLIERGTVREIFSNPKEKFTQELLRSVPKLPYGPDYPHKNLRFKPAREDKELEFFLNTATAISKRI